MSPSTVVQPLTSKETVNAPPLPERSSVFEVIDPVAPLAPSFTAPPAENAFADVGKLAVRFVVTAVLDGEPVPEVAVLPPAVSVAKSSARSVTVVPLVTTLPLAVVSTFLVVAPPPLTTITRPS